MKIMDKFVDKVDDNYNQSGVTIAFFGDSVTQGCFEVYCSASEKIETVFDKENAYHAHLQRIFATVYPSVPVNIINAGVSGDNAVHALQRIERDVIKFCPDLVVVCFGLNDSGQGAEGVKAYGNALAEIFKMLLMSGTEIVFMTPNMMNTDVSVHITDPYVKDVAKKKMIIQKQGILDMYIEEAKRVCSEYNIKVCDCYEKWKLLEKNGANITELLANKINHPTRAMNWLFAVSLFETMLT